jgi:hypothetical protein
MTDQKAKNPKRVGCLEKGNYALDGEYPEVAFLRPLSS